MGRNEIAKCFGTVIVQLKHATAYEKQFSSYLIVQSVFESIRIVKSGCTSGAEGLRFHSAFVPAFRLTDAEVSELQRACFAHRGQWESKC